MIKPGYRTSEFWFTLVSFVFSGLYLVGLLDNHDQKENLIHETTRGVEATILIIGQLAVLFRYINGRVAIKQTWWNTATPEERENVNTKPKKPTKRPTKRPTKKPKV